jgi:hypothetical protein
MKRIEQPRSLQMYCLGAAGKGSCDKALWISGLLFVHGLSGFGRGDFPVEEVPDAEDSHSRSSELCTSLEKPVSFPDDGEESTIAKLNGLVGKELFEADVVSLMAETSSESRPTLLNFSWRGVNHSAGYVDGSQ